MTSCERPNMRFDFLRICNETSSAMRHHRRKTERSRVQLHTGSRQCEQRMLTPAAAPRLIRTLFVAHSSSPMLPPMPDAQRESSPFCRQTETHSPSLFCFKGGGHPLQLSSRPLAEHDRPVTA